MCKGDSLKDKEEISSEEERDIESTNYAKGKLVAKEEKVDTQKGEKHVVSVEGQLRGENAG